MPNLRLLPRPRMVQRGNGLRGAIKKIGHYARPVLNTLAKTLLPLGVKQLQRVGSNFVKRGADILTRAVEKKNGLDKTGGRLFFPLIQEQSSKGNTSSLPENIKKRKKRKTKAEILNGGKKGGRKKRKTKTKGKKIGGKRKKKKKTKALKRKAKKGGKKKGGKKKTAVKGGKKGAKKGGKKGAKKGGKKKAGGKKRRGKLGGKKRGKKTKSFSVFD